MRAELKELGSRTIVVTDLPDEYEDIGRTIEITLNYTGNGNAGKGVCLDGFIKPLVVSVLNEELTERWRDYECKHCGEACSFDVDDLVEVGTPHCYGCDKPVC